jgi:hypothetical protein
VNKLESHYEVELYYTNGTVESICKLENIINDILICYDDETSTKEEGLYINPIDGQEQTISLDNIDEIYIIEVDKYDYIEDRFLFWRRES